VPQPATNSAPRLGPSRNSSTFMGRAPGGAGLAPRNSSEMAGDPAKSIKVAPRSDPDAEAAIRRRVEKQIQQSLGDRVRSVEVRVSGRTVYLRAQVAWFWQRRAVRRSLETMPLPAGYQAKVESVD
jgi:hypothetical protein